MFCPHLCHFAQGCLLNLFIFYIDSVKILELAARCNTIIHVASWEAF